MLSLLLLTSLGGVPHLYEGCSFAFFRRRARAVPSCTTVVISHLRAVVSNSEVYRVFQVLNGGMPPESVGAVDGNKNVQPSVPNSAAITFVDPAVGGPSVLFFMGANGMGKTTTVGKVASRLREEGGQKVLLAAADTFRYGIG